MTVLAPDARGRFETDEHNNPTCPIWAGLKIVSFQYPSVEQNILAEGSRYYSSRAGGPFLLMKDGAALLDWESPDDEQKSLTDRQKVNLSYWIYQHNLENRLLDELSNQILQNPGGFARWMDDHRERVLKLNKAWVEIHRNWEPSTSDCLLTYLRELIRNADAGQPQPNKDLLKAAGGCRKDYDLLELERHTVDQGWTGSNKPGSEGTSPYFINLPARLYVDERLGELGPERQGFVAMWFDESMDDAYKCGIKLAIQDAGYKPRLIKEKEYLGGVVDEIMAEIRKSRFVVADFTSSTKAGARGGVYFEAGFAYGLDIPVFLTCRKGCKEGVHFDIGHLNRLEWETPEDLRKQLKNSIEAILGRGPLDPPDGQPTDSRQPERTAT